MLFAVQANFNYGIFVESLNLLGVIYRITATVKKTDVSPFCRVLWCKNQSEFYCHSIPYPAHYLLHLKPAP
jgi:hypothetical protein